MLYRLWLQVDAAGRAVAGYVPDQPVTFFDVGTAADVVTAARAAIAADRVWLGKYHLTSADETIEVATAETTEEDWGRHVFVDEWTPLDEPARRQLSAFLVATRLELLDVIARAPPAFLDWTYEVGGRFETPRGIVAHLASAECYYLSRLEDHTERADGVRAELLGARADALERLHYCRAVTMAAYALLDDEGRARQTVHRGQSWTARKALRRALWHERDHTLQLAGLLQTYYQNDVAR